MPVPKNLRNGPSLSANKLSENYQKKGGDFMSAWGLDVQDSFLTTVSRQDLLQLLVQVWPQKVLTYTYDLMGGV